MNSLLWRISSGQQCKWIIYGNQSGSDNAFTRKVRLLQSMYKVEIGEKEGFGLTRAFKRKYGNMISGGEVFGKSLL